MCRQTVLARFKAGIHSAHVAGTRSSEKAFRVYCIGRMLQGQ